MSRLYLVRNRNKDIQIIIMQFMLMRLMSKSEYLIVPKETKLT